MIESPALTEENRHLLAACHAALEDTKAKDVFILDVSRQSSLTRYLLIASATSEPHLRALKRDVSQTLKDCRATVLGAEGTAGSGWLALDAFDVMIHLFTEPVRETYKLESLWKDAEEVAVEALREADSAFPRQA